MVLVEGSSANGTLESVTFSERSVDTRAGGAKVAQNSKSVRSRKSSANLDELSSPKTLLPFGYSGISQLDDFVKHRESILKQKL